MVKNLANKVRFAAISFIIWTFSLVFAAVVIIFSLLNVQQKEAYTTGLLNLVLNSSVLIFDLHDIGFSPRIEVQWQAFIRDFSEIFSKLENKISDDVQYNSLLELESGFKRLEELYNRIKIEEVKKESFDLTNRKQLYFLFRSENETLLNKIKTMANFYRRDLQNSIYSLILLVVAGVLGYVLFCWLVYRGAMERFLKPIDRLIKGTLEFTRGNFDFRFQNFKNDEVGELATSFNEMTIALENANRDLYKNDREKSLVLDHLSSGLVVLDDTGKILRINNMALNILEISDADTIGKNWEDVSTIYVEEGIKINCIDLIKKVLEKGEPLYYNNYFLEKKNGELMPAIFGISQLIDKNGAKSVILLFRDNTDEMKQGRANKEFLTLASHQLKTPINVIDWYSEQLLSGDLDNLNKEQRLYLEEIKSRNKDMSALVTTLLDLSSRSHGLDIALNKFNIDILIREILKELDNLATRKNVEILYDSKTQGQWQLEIISRRALVKVVLYNIIENAINYSKQGANVKISFFKDEKCTCIIVEDFGIGISSEDIEKIFHRSFRAKNAIEINSNGSGFGLYLAKFLSGLAGIKISVESQVNEGTTFKICFKNKD